MAELGGDGEVKYFSEETLRKQISLLMRAWGMPEDYIDTTAKAMADADACGIDTHGISMIPPYEDRRKRNVITLDANITVVKETPTTALIDAGGGLGYVPYILATDMCITKAKECGMAAVTVKESAHFGATGYYTRMMSRAGLIGIATTNGSGPRTAPTFGKDGKLNPINGGFDLWSSGDGGKSSGPLAAAVSRDDIVRANNGTFIGLGEDY